MYQVQYDFKCSEMDDDAIDDDDDDGSKDCDDGEDDDNGSDCDTNRSIIDCLQPEAELRSTATSQIDS